MVLDHGHPFMSLILVGKYSIVLVQLGTSCTDLAFTRQAGWFVASVNEVLCFLNVIKHSGGERFTLLVIVNVNFSLLLRDFIGYPDRKMKSYKKKTQEDNETQQESEETSQHIQEETLQQD